MSSRTRTRFAKRIALGLAVAAAAVPVASAKPVPGLLPNGPVSDEASAQYLTVTEQGQYGIPSGGATASAPDAFERAVRNHVGDVGGSSSALVRQTPDGYQPQLRGDESTARFVRDQPDGYQPQLRGGERVPVSAPTAEPGSGFDWSDAGIGFGLAAAIALLGGIGIGVLGRGKLATGH